MGEQSGVGEQSNVGLLTNAEKRDKDVERGERKRVGDGMEENAKNKAELQERCQSWIEEDWYKEVVWFRLFGLR